MANACVPAAALVVKIRYLVHTGWLSARGPGRYTNTGHRNEDLIFGRDQIDNFSGILAEIRSITSPIFFILFPLRS